MASSSKAPARLRSFHVALARSIASAAAFVSAWENPPVDANGPGARMPTTSSTCRSSPPRLPPLGAPRRSAPATDDAIPRTRDMTPPDILPTVRASERASDARLTRRRVRSPDSITQIQTLTSGPSVLQSRTFRPLAIPGTSLHAYLSLSTCGPSNLRRTYQPSARFSTSCVR